MSVARRLVEQMERRWVHIGRVNSARRIRMCSLSRATSFDGSSASRFAVTTPLLDAARRQMTLPLAKNLQGAK